MTGGLVGPPVIPYTHEGRKERKMMLLIWVDRDGNSVGAYDQNACGMVWPERGTRKVNYTVVVRGLALREQGDGSSETG